MFLDAFIGPGCEYVIAPVARYAGQWGIPVLTAGAQAQAFTYKDPSYATLTRMMGSYLQAGIAIRKVFEVILWLHCCIWKRICTCFVNCFLMLSAYKRAFIFILFLFYFYYHYVSLLRFSKSLQSIRHSYSTH